MQEHSEDRNAAGIGFQIVNRFEDRLPDDTTNAAARRQALDSFAQTSWKSTGVVSYRSRGRLLIVDRMQAGEDGRRAIEIAAGLAGDGIDCTVVIDGLEPDSRDRVCRQLSTRNVRVVAGRLSDLHGFLGQFAARLEGKRDDMDLVPPGAAAGDCFDLVLDLCSPPILQRQVLPPGYYAPRGDGEYLQAALQEIPQVSGDFGKPVYVQYRPGICTHGDRGITGCSRCLDVCPAEAIADKGEKIEVNTSLCQGCGSCVMNCPTGALSYAFPPVQQWLTAIRDMLSVYRDAGGSGPDLLVYDSGSEDSLKAAVETLPDRLIPVPVEEIGSLGMDAWLSILAYGADSVSLLIAPGTPRNVLSELDTQVSVTHALLEGMGYSRNRLRRIGTDTDSVFTPDMEESRSGEENPPAGFNPFEKQKTIRTALEHLYRHAPGQQQSVTLPEGAPFGEIRVDHDTCTLCMSCVAICPVQALQHDTSQLRLEFMESSCVQCGLCRNACPEGSISLFPRYVYDQTAAATPRLLNEDESFHCIACGKPFIGRRMYERITEKLAGTGTWNIREDDPPRWLQMCGDCRIKEPRPD